MLDKTSLQRAIDFLTQQDISEGKSRYHSCKELLEFLLYNQDELKEIAPFNYHYIGERFENYLLNGTYHNKFEDFYLLCMRFLREIIFYIRRNKDEGFFLESAWSFFDNETMNSFDDNNHQYVHYIREKMGIDILNFYFGQDGFKAFKEYGKFKIDIDKSNKNLLKNKENFEKFLSEKEESVKRLESVLNEQKTAFNFVGLSKGFENLLDKKITARNWTFGFLIGISIALLATPLVYICLLLNNPEIIKNPELWKPLLPFIGLEIIFLYFFRVILNHYNSIQTQIMQLELRQSLCQFIQSYADYAKEIKEKDDISLEKFENIIFSNILSDGNKVPGTFDGIETLASLIKEIRGGK
ncbi:hypothetical protein [Pasteurella oralis]|uniref:hypothetical protein n=1 Tax=Pasteurella oralis TaxID=1071947 RepID=UPI001FEC650C|nr:hypothetical protein [Pasteurella oralis]